MRTMSSSLRLWIAWYEINSCDPITCPINKICDFFVDMMAKEKPYNTITGYRTAISKIHEIVDSVSIGSHSDIFSQNSNALDHLKKENNKTLV